MNNILKEKGLKKLKEKIYYYMRFFGKNKASLAFDEKNNNSISRIYVINLDRKPDRWECIKKELHRIKINYNKSLYDISRRFSAIDGRYYKYNKDNTELKNYYKLSDQLKVEPNNKYNILKNEDDFNIYMTKQEIAVTLSHIEVWKKMKEENIEYALILEDDVYFTNKFSTNIDKIWNDISETEFDILFLSFDYVKGISKKEIYRKEFIHKPYVGIWQASGYVLSKKGVQKLLKELPVYGPVDLWLNLKFEKLKALMINEPIIKQRVDIESTNSYSIMPVFTKLGLYSENKPLIIKQKRKLPFLLAYGDENSGLTSLAEALSMIGYTCCNNLISMPNIEFIKSKKQNFNAYVNVGEFDLKLMKLLKKKYKNLKVIYTTSNYKKYLQDMNIESLFLPKEYNDKWELLSKFINIEYPVFDYPNLKDKKQMKYTISHNNFKDNNILWDNLPWICYSKDNRGIEILKAEDDITEALELEFDNSKDLDLTKLEFRNDTFPSNLAIFKPENVCVTKNVIKLNLKREDTMVRNYTASAIVTKNYQSFGKFSAKIKPSGVEGIITGMFLHRNSPHQEIDIEFLGKNHFGFLANIFYNPGVEGTKLEYGYRGTPTWINLDFDVTEKFHKYEIEWTEFYIIWRVDGKEVYKRNIWQPTPIPQLPMQFNLNIWNTKSVELAGNLNDDNLPAISYIKSIEVCKYEKNNKLVLNNS